MHRIGNGAAIYLTVVAVAFAWIMVEVERIDIREIAKGMKKPSVKKELAELKVEAKKLDELKTKEKAISKGVVNNPIKTNKKVKSNR